MKKQKTKSLKAWAAFVFLLFSPAGAIAEDTMLPPIPPHAKLVLQENWSSGRIDDKRWYLPRKKWGQGNHGVVPENVRLEKDMVFGKERHVLVCQANGDLYDGPILGYDKNQTRVGGMIVTKDFFASGRYEVVMKIGGTVKSEGGPEDPMRPKGAVPAVWTFGYRYVSVASDGMDSFHKSQPLYNPHMKVYGTGANEYWSEIDFPEFGKEGDFDRALYNTFLQNKHQTRTFDVKPMIDGEYHTLVTDWRTKLVPIDDVKDSQVAKDGDFYWVQDRAIPYNLYYGNPLKRLGKDSYAVYAGDRADHYLDGKKVAENVVFVPSMSAQLSLGIWLPGWGGAAPWEQSSCSFASIRIWQYHDEGDVRGVITDNITNNFTSDGTPH